MQLDEEAVRDTALGLWLRGDEHRDAPPPEDRPILEVLPLNTEQRQAVVQGLSAPLTVVTGPPGTGKSQVVTSLLANMAWQDGSVLFSSKNNHAVDVVESRVNDLGPVSAAVAAGQGRASCADRAATDRRRLAESASADVATRYAWLMRAHEQDRARFAAVQQRDRRGGGVAQSRWTNWSARRNRRERCSARSGLPACGRWMSEGMRRALQALAAALDAARETASRRWSGCCAIR